MLADMPLVKNLDNPQYMKILLNGKANLEELFAEFGLSPLAKNDQAEPEPNLIIPGFRKLLTMKNLPSLMLGVSISSHGEEKSN